MWHKARVPDYALGNAYASFGLALMKEKPYRLRYYMGGAGLYGAAWFMEPHDVAAIKVILYFIMVHPVTTDHEDILYGFWLNSEQEKEKR